MNQNSIYIRAKENLEQLLFKAEKLINNYNNLSIPESLPKEELKNIDTIVENCDHRKGVLTVLITLLSYKIVVPKQDIRIHQANMDNGFSGRTFDTKIVTPFMKKNRFPAMVESGWLTRSLEQNRPYDLNYPGKISPDKLKQSFLKILDFIERKNSLADDYLIYLFQKLLYYRKNDQIHLIVKPLQEKKISIKKIIFLLNEHFESCSTVGKARLPVLAMYSIYECIVSELNRYINKKLQPLGSHTSADSRSGEIGDINILYENIPFEGVEIKYGKPITSQIIKDSYEKFKIYPIDRYYLLSTASIKENETKEVEDVICDISKSHGCQVIVNGILPTIRYYLRLINNTNKFIEKYAHYIEIDDVIKLEHKKCWNNLVKNITNIT